MSPIRESPRISTLRSPAAYCALDSPLESPGSQLSVNVNVALLLIKMVPYEAKKVAPKPQEGESAYLEPSPALQPPLIYEVRQPLMLVLS